MGLFLDFFPKNFYSSRSLGVKGGVKMDPLKSIKLIDNMVSRILSSGKVSDEKMAFEIARRWFKGSAG